MNTVCHITVRHSPSDTRIFHKECKTLSQYYNVVLMAPGAGNTEIEGIRMIDLKPTPEGWFQRMKYAFGYLYKKARAEKAAIYHLHDPELLPLALLLRRTGHKVIFDVHEDYASTFNEHGYSKIVIRAFHYFNKKVARQCGIILAESSYINLYRDIARNYCVVENFCNPAQFAGYIVPNRSSLNRLIYIGTLHTHRGALYMLEVLHQLRKKGLDLSLDLVGNSTEPKLMAKAEALPFYREIKNHVVWHGRLPLRESYALTQQAFAGLCLLDYQPNHMESYPTKLFEYMACGLPVVASNIPLYKAVVERRECGITVPYGDAETAAEKIEEMYRNPEQRQAFAANGPDAVRMNYNWNAEENILLDFYKKMLG